MDIGGKLALVTGGSDGIGKALARQLRDAGAHVIVSGRDPAKLAVMASDGFETFAADLASSAGIDALVAFVAERPLDLLINNAGVGADHVWPDGINLGSSDRCIATNLTAPIHLTARLAPQLATRPQAMIVNVTSGLAIAPRSGSPVYCAAKAGLRSYTQAMRRQLRGTPVHVMEALPPMVATNLTAGRGGRMMTADDCAAAIIAGIRRNADQVNVGMVKLLSIIHSFSPALARRIMLKL